MLAHGGSHAKSYKDREVCMVEEIRVDFVTHGCCSSPVLLLTYKCQYLKYIM